METGNGGKTEGRRSPDWATLGIFLILAFAALASARDFLMPLSMGILLFFVFSPVCRALSRIGVPRPIGAGAVILPGRVIHPAGVACIFRAQGAFGVTALRGQFGGGNGSGVFFGF